MTTGAKNETTDITGRGYLKGIAIDAVIFGFHDNQLKVLLIEYKRTGLFALPGGVASVAAALPVKPAVRANQKLGRL